MFLYIGTTRCIYLSGEAQDAGLLNRARREIGNVGVLLYYLRTLVYMSIYEYIYVSIYLSICIYIFLNMHICIYLSREAWNAGRLNWALKKIGTVSLLSFYRLHRYATCFETMHVYAICISNLSREAQDARELNLGAQGNRPSITAEQVSFYSTQITYI